MTRDRQPLKVSVHRGSVLESTHSVHALVVDAGGGVVRSWGDSRRLTVLRSAAKPFQALPLVADGAADHYGFTGEEIALCCGSHNSEERHLATVRSMLAKAGVAESHLVCGPHVPLWRDRERELAGSDTPLTAIMNNCSGKHAGMLALAAFHGWALEGYEQPGHPVQRRIRREIAHWTRTEPDALGEGLDGCGVPTFAVPLEGIAGAMARLAAAAADGGAPGRVANAMVRFPFMVAGSERLCTCLMGEERDHLLAKAGAEGVYAAADLHRQLGIALKVADGAWRAAPPALLAVLERTSILSQGTMRALARFSQPPIVNTLGEDVGRLVVER